MKAQGTVEPTKWELLRYFIGPSARLCWLLAIANGLAIWARGMGSPLFAVLIPLLVLFPIVANLRVIRQVMNGETKRGSGVIADVYRPLHGRSQKRMAQLTLEDGSKFVTYREGGLSFPLEAGREIAFIYLEGRKEDGYHLIVMFLAEGPKAE